MIPSSIADVCVLLGILGINKKGMLSPRENQRKETYVYYYIASFYEGACDQGY